MCFNVVGAVAALFLLAACSTAQDNSASSSGGGSSSSGTVTSATQPAAQPSAPSGPVPGSQEDLVVNVGDRVFFGFDKYDLSDDAQATLRKQASWMATHKNVTVTVEGHCDERGTREYNLALGERRANAVRDYLLALGVDSNRIQIISYGKERPAVAGSTEEAWSKNRRGVTTVN